MLRTCLSTLSASLLVSASFVTVALVTATFVTAGERPNVLFIAVDDLRPELGCYGVERAHSPHIDALAKRGLRFDRAYCQQAVCSPSRTSLLTGMRPDSTRVYDLETHFRKTIPNVVTLPQHFKSQGYHACGMGKIYHGGLDDKESWSEPWRAPKAQAYGLPENLQLLRKKSAAAKEKGLKGQAASRAARGPAYESSAVADNTFHDGALADMAIEKLDELSQKDQPFFLAVGFIRPHLPFVSPQKYWELYERTALTLPDNRYPPRGAPPFALVNSGELRAYEGIPAKGSVSDDESLALIHGYLAAVSYMDAQVGRLTAELARLKLTDNTIVILWGDHGWKLADHGEWCKHTNFEIDTHVPLIISGPGVRAGKASRGLVEFVDIYPSLCELAGLELPPHLEGTSFVPLLQQPERPWKTAAFSQYPRSVSGQQLMGYSLRTDRYRYTRWVERKPPNKVVAVELYDHERDPQENQNLAGQEKYAATEQQLQEQWSAGWQGAKPE
jgi:arylsulfatase A-like enzyme